MIRNPFARTRRPRPTDPEPYTRLDVLDGLPGREAQFSQCDETCTAEHARTRYESQWADVLAAEEVGGDLAAMAAPGDWPLGDYGKYEIEPEERATHRRDAVALDLQVSVAEFTEVMEDLAAALRGGDLTRTAVRPGLPIPTTSTPIYRACLAGHVGAEVA